MFWDVAGANAAELILMAVAGAVAFLLTVALTGPSIRWLASRQIGKAIRSDGPSHQSKSGTPTMGGIAMIAALLIEMVAFSAWVRDIDLRLVTLAVALVGFGALGAVDDLAGLARRGQVRELGIGLSARRMLSLQFVLAIVLALIAWSIRDSMGPRDLSLEVPSFSPDPFAALGAFASPWGDVIWIAIGAMVIVGSVNGVNLSDGLDGLAAGLLAIAFGALALVCMLAPAVSITSMWCFAAAGACAGFLVYNRHPARIFMGNVGSMGLGAALGTAALVTGTWALLPIIGAVFVAEVLSDIIQIGLRTRPRQRRSSGGRPSAGAQADRHKFAEQLSVL